MTVSLIEAAVVAAFPNSALREAAKIIHANQEKLALPLALWARTALSVGHPPDRQTTAKLSELVEALGRVSALLEKVGADGNEALRQAALGLVSENSPPLLRLGGLIYSVRYLCLVAERALEQCPEIRRGPTPKLELYKLVDGLYDVHLHVVGKPPTRRWSHNANDGIGADKSVFPVFCRFCIKAIFGRDPTSLRGICQHVLRKRNEDVARRLRATSSVGGGDS